jgi:hypothetical protein
MSLTWRLFAHENAPHGQHLADATSAERMFDERIWPDGMSAVDASRRIDISFRLAKQARRNGRPPMAWLTERLKQEVEAP